MYPLLIKKEVLKTCYIIIIISLSCALFSFTKIDFNRIRTMGIGTNRTLKDNPSIEVHPLSIWVSTRSKWVSIRSTWARICIHFFHFKFQMMANDALLSQLLSFWHYNPTWITKHHTNGGSYSSKKSWIYSDLYNIQVMYCMRSTKTFDPFRVMEI